MDILGMPLDAWILLAASIGMGLGLEILYIRARRRSGYVAADGGAQDAGRALRAAEARVTGGESS